MKFDRKQKKRLKKLHIWKRVKFLTKNSAKLDGIKPSKSCTIMNSFDWNDTEEGIAFWSIVNRKVLSEVCK